MPNQIIPIDSIFGGLSPTSYFGREGSYLAGLAIDPDMPVVDSGAGSIRTSGQIRPVGYETFDGALLNANPYWLITNPKNSTIYAVLNNGRILSYSSALGSETDIGDTFTVTIASPGVFTSTAHGLAANDRVRLYTTGALPTGLTANTTYYVISAGLTADAFELSASEGGAAINTSGTQSGTHTFSVEAGNGAIYYNNYLYFVTNFDISRYGPLDGTPAMVHGVWRGSTLGTQTALVNTTYPSIRGSGVMPNHPMCVHLDNKLYICDYNNATYPGQGIIHYIKTKKTTNEGDTNDNSTANSLDLPFGFRPTIIASYGEDLVIAAIQSTDTVTDQGNAALFFWDTVSTSFYKQIFLDEPIISALKVVNGILYVFAGKLAAANTAGNGYSVYQYLGGQSFREIIAFEEGWPPLAGAVDANGDRVVWGSCFTDPANAACAWSYGSKNGAIPPAVHNIARSTAAASATDGLVTCLGYVLQANNARPRLVIGARDASNFHLEQISTTYQTSIWRSQVFNIGQAFQVKEIKLHFAQALAANMTLTPTIYLDDASSSQAGTIINSTNYGSSQRTVILTSDNFSNVSGKHNFYLELQFSGTALLTVVLPITIKIELLDDITQ